MHRTIVALSFLVALLGCATGSSIVTGKVRPAISPSEVKIYLDPPSQFETIGIVEASSEVEFSSQSGSPVAVGHRLPDTRGLTARSHTQHGQASTRVKLAQQTLVFTSKS